MSFYAAEDSQRHYELHTPEIYRSPARSRTPDQTYYSPASPSPVKRDWSYGNSGFKRTESPITREVYAHQTNGTYVDSQARYRDVKNRCGMLSNPIFKGFDHETERAHNYLERQKSADSFKHTESYNCSAKKAQKRNLLSSPHELFNPQWFEDWQKRKNTIQEVKERE